ncbi:MAG: sensor histidine kinase [Thermoflexales bacterium]
MPIRLRLTLWYTGVLAVLLVIISVGVYTPVRVLLYQQLDSRLTQAADTVLPLVHSQPVELMQRNGRQVISFPTLDAFRSSEIYVQLISNSGELIGASPNIFDANFDSYLDPEAFRYELSLSHEQQSDYFSDYSHSNTPPLRVLTRPIYSKREPGGLLGFVQVGVSRENVEVALGILSSTLLVSSVVGLMLSFFVGALIARRALKPVEEITRTAMAIYRADNLDQRVAVPKTNDEIAQLSRAFNEMLDRLKRLFDAQQRLVADVSHEMRTPLTVIRGNVDLLRAMGCADQESLDALTRESERMTRLVSDLLLLSQADAGELPMRFTKVNVSQLAHEVGRIVQVLANGRISVVVKAEDDLVMDADPDRLKQVLINLVDNAIKHTPDGGEVRIECVSYYNGFIRLSVSDTGVGIPEKDLPHIFERFYRVDKSRSRAYGGAGLGLSIVYTIVQAHHGRIVVNSKEGVGTTFDIYIPATQSQAGVAGGVPSRNGALGRF